MTERGFVAGTFSYPDVDWHKSPDRFASVLYPSKVDRASVL